MALQRFQALPIDFFHLLAAELSDRLDYSTLYNCIVSSKTLASSGAVNALYRISHQSPIKGGNDGLSLAEQELTTQRWSILWRSIILSTFEQTLFPYSRYLRALDLRDLESLIEDDRFRGATQENFFSGKLEEFHFTQLIRGKKRPRGYKRLDTRKIVLALGNRITHHAPLLESLSESANVDVLAEALLDWAPRLSCLRSLEFGDGKALANEAVRNLLHVHCPHLSTLRIFICSNEDADHSVATFISEMPQNRLTHFETISHCRIGPETCLALNRHGRSLHSLKLGSLDESGVRSLGLLQDCTAIETLELSSSTASPDLKATQNDTYLEIVSWLQSCNALQDISIGDFVSAPDLLLHVLQNKNTKLKKLEISAKTGEYISGDHHDFHKALAEQPSLCSLVLRADPEPTGRDNIEVLMNAFCSLKDLRTLRLYRISDYFSDEQIVLLSQNLSNLEDLDISGYGISDTVWPSLAKLPLKVVNFGGITTFTEDGILDFIERLDSVLHRGIELSVTNADPDAAIGQDSLDIIRDVLATKLDGKFDYVLLRDPNAWEGDSEDDSD